MRLESAYPHYPLPTPLLSIDSSTLVRRTRLSSKHGPQLIGVRRSCSLSRLCRNTWIDWLTNPDSCSRFSWFNSCCWRSSSAAKLWFLFFQVFPVCLATPSSSATSASFLQDSYHYTVSTCRCENWNDFGFLPNRFRLEKIQDRFCWWLSFVAWQKIPARLNEIKQPILN